MSSIDNNVNYVELVEKARVGDEESMNRLAELVEGRLFAYIYRLTLDYDLTQDLLQETLLGMVQSLKDLKDARRFWAWLFRSALGKVQHYFRERRREEKVQISAVEKERLLRRVPQDYTEGLSELVQKELSDAIFEAMLELKLHHRSILALRCFEQMPYSEIASFMNCSELQARVLFFRAKHSFRRHLSRHGFGKASLLMALGLLGLMTASAKAASATGVVTAGSLEVGFAATVLGAASTKLGVTFITAITVAILSLTVERIICVGALLCFTLFCFIILFSFTDMYSR